MSNVAPGAIQWFTQAINDGNLEEAGQDGGRVFSKDRGDDQSEDGQDNGEGQEEDGEEEEAGALAEDPSCDISHRLAPVAHGNHEGTKIVDRTDENGSEKNPEQGGHPPPDHGQGGPDNGTGSRDAGEVMPEDDAFAGGDVVGAVLHLDGGDPGRGIELEDPAGQEPAVGVVGHQVKNEGAKRDGEG